MAAILAFVSMAAMLTCCSSSAGNGHPVAPGAAVTTVHVKGQYVVMDNGIVRLTLSNPEGFITEVMYNGVDNLLEVHSSEPYWDVVWNEEENEEIFELIEGSQFQIIYQDDKKIEVSFKKKWNPSLKGKRSPLNIDKRYIYLQINSGDKSESSSGFYTYAIYEHVKGWPDFQITETRIAFKLRKEKFHYMAIADNRQRVMPMLQDRSPKRSQKLAYPEAVILVKPTNPALRGEVDDKYQYSSEYKDSLVHGWICAKPSIGFWLITPSNEFKSGGPLRQDLTSHVGPTVLGMFHSSHYAGEEIVAKFTNGEYWKKVFGPVFIYLNSDLKNSRPNFLWEDAKRQTQIEVANWPYEFPTSVDYLKKEQRGSVSGRLLILDKYISKNYIYGNATFVGLASPGEEGSWQKETKGYQFWVRANAKGNFFIKNVLSGVYNLYAWLPGFIGEFTYSTTITVTSGGNIDLHNLVYRPPRDGPTLWEIGIPDRSAAEFFVPDPNPKYVNKLYIEHDKFRQYGLWEKYADLYPTTDLIYQVGVSNYTKDWFFAQVTRFTLTGVYKLRVALASAHLSKLQVRINDPTIEPAHFTTELIGRDNAIARHGIHGFYWLFNISLQGSWLREGENTIFLTQSQSQTMFQGIMYDYIRMEAT
ncbi:hypothetical protein ZIOFF_024145 [Zingiber officinale]|uniref:rhamnogalacturonan endolyase n=1 Tax=Zingiber officinale TaxID=94328 RepID=A0A8J5GXU3_ZINOF|nr:hypothetical protein ZIOFF_024145 [Zingiber officinale]